MRDYEQKERERLEQENLKSEQERVNVERQTEWERVAAIKQKIKQEAASTCTYRVLLKEENDAPLSTGLNRSHSSPNIAKFAQEKGNVPFRNLQPNLNMNRTDPKKIEYFSAKVRNLQPTLSSVAVPRHCAITSIPVAGYWRL